MTYILIIEDNEDLGQLLADLMRREGFSVSLAKSAEEGLELLGQEVFRLLLLDVMLPGRDGFEALSEIRRSRDMPVIMMSAMTDDDSKIKGMEIGADDYIDKPFSFPVIASKVKALMRRTYERVTEKELLTACGITVDTGARRAYKDGKEIGMNGKEYDLLVYLMRHKGQALSKEVIFNAVWGEDCCSELASLSVYISWLRDKIEDDPKKPRLIQTVYRVGYRFGDGQ